MNLFIFICQQTLIFLVPLLLVGLGDLFSERSGVLNIARGHHGLRRVRGHHVHPLGKCRHALMVVC